MNGKANESNEKLFGGVITLTSDTKFVVAVLSVFSMGVASA